jgi:hypothetical protein
MLVNWIPAINIDYNQLVDKAGDGSTFTPFTGGSNGLTNKK